MCQRHAELRRIGEQRGQAGRDALRFGQIGGLGRLVRMAEAWAIEDHLFLLPSRQEWETRGAGRTPDGVEAVAIDAGKPDIGLRQLLAAHALDRIAPEAIDPSDETHLPNPFANISSYSTMSRLVLSTNASASARSLGGTWKLSKVASR